MDRLEEEYIRIDAIIKKTEKRLASLERSHGRTLADPYLEDWECAELLEELDEEMADVAEHLAVMKEQQTKVWKEYQDEKRNRASNQSRES
jgi:two-component sensor histidine kinase